MRSIDVHLPQSIRLALLFSRRKRKQQGTDRGPDVLYIDTMGTEQGLHGDAPRNSQHHRHQSLGRDLAKASRLAVDHGLNNGQQGLLGTLKRVLHTLIEREDGMCATPMVSRISPMHAQGFSPLVLFECSWAKCVRKPSRNSDNPASNCAEAQADVSRPRQMQEKRDALGLQRHCPEHSSGALLFLWRPRSHQSQHAAAHSVPIRNPRRTCSATDRLPPRFVLHRGAQASCCATGGNRWSANQPSPCLAPARASAQKKPTASIRPSISTSF